MISVFGDLEGAPVTKVLALTGLHVTTLNLGADSISGVATPGAEVEVCINIPGNCVSRWVTADIGDGTWTADYAGEYDLQMGDNGWAAEYEADSDRGHGMTGTSRFHGSRSGDDNNDVEAYGMANGCSSHT